MEVDGEDAHQLVKRLYWGGAEGTSNVPDCSILGLVQVF